MSLTATEDRNLEVWAYMALERRRCEESLYYFLKYMWPVVVGDEFIDNWHIRYLCDTIQPHLERVIRREPKECDIVINVPPGSTKTLIFSIMIPAWVWIKDPAGRFITGSYESKLANESAVRSRDILKSEKFKDLWGHVEFKSDMDMKSGYANTLNGARKTCSIGGNITGSHAHYIIIDDPLNPKKIASEVEKQGANDWLDKTLSTRKVDKLVTLTILIMQRLGEDDCSGHMLGKDKKVLHICLPGEITELGNVSPPEAERYYFNGLMDVHRMNRFVLDELKIDLGSREYAGQILQHPAAVEGSIFKREWWRYYDQLPNEPLLMKLHSWDTAFKKGKENAKNALVVANWYKSGLYLLDTFQEHMDFPELENEVQLKYSKHGGHSVLIEDKASGQDLIAILKKETDVPVVPVKVEMDKEARAHASTAYIEAGNVFLPARAGWVSDFVDTMAGFPDIKYKDIVDAFVQLVLWVMRGRTTEPKISSRRVRLKGNLMRF